MITTDRPRETRKERSAFAKVRNAEHEYANRLRSLARQVGHFVRGFFKPDVVPDPSAAAEVERLLHAYAETITPWAQAVGARMLSDVERRDAAAWSKLSRTMSRNLRDEIMGAPTGQVMREAMARQVDLITSLPRDAATRVHEVAIKHLYSGERAGEIRGDPSKAVGMAADILKTGDVTVSRANLIARTETTRAASELLSARAQHVGSEGYVWRTARDRDVRKAHKDLEGTYHRWDDPPVAELSGQRHHPGEFPNCRCWPDPVLPEHIT